MSKREIHFHLTELQRTQLSVLSDLRSIPVPDLCRIAVRQLLDQPDNLRSMICHGTCGKVYTPNILCAQCRAPKQGYRIEPEHESLYIVQVDGWGETGNWRSIGSHDTYHGAITQVRGWWR